MRKSFGRFFPAMAVISMASLSSPASAGSVTSASIIKTYAFSGNTAPTLFFVALNQNDGNIGCNSANLPLFVIDVSTVGGRAQAASILSAQASGQTVSIVGTGTCNIAATTESAGSVSIP